MKKCLALLLALMMLVCASCAFAEAAPVLDTENSACPLHMPPVPEEIYAQWQLFATDAPLELEMSAFVDPSSNCFVLLLNNLLDWGVAPEYLINWVYDTGAEAWTVDTTSDIQRENAAVLSIDAEYYYMNGFPGWECYSEDETFSYVLMDYSGDPNNPDYHLNFISGDTTIQIAVTGEGFTMSSFGEDSMSYAVYEDSGMMTTGIYTREQEDVYVSYAYIPNEDPAEAEKEPYILYYINVQTADGGNYLWTEGAWQDIHGEEVKAPEGFSAEELPFELIVE